MERAKIFMVMTHTQVNFRSVLGRRSGSCCVDMLSKPEYVVTSLYVMMETSLLHDKCGYVRLKIQISLSDKLVSSLSDEPEIQSATSLLLL